MYEAEIFFIKKLRKFPFETYIVLKSVKFSRKKNDRKVLKKSLCNRANSHKSLRFEISSAVIFHGRELNLMSK